jgi:hypothetical protein
VELASDGGILLERDRTCGNKIPQAKACATETAPGISHVSRIEVWVRHLKFEF